ncbi:MAG: hypothetical protein ACHQX4_00395 [Gemmatimonadales bacterium]
MASSGSPWPGLIVFGVVGVGIAGTAYASYLAEKKRNAAMRAVAQAMGFAYEEQANRRPLDITGFDLPLFGIGHSRKAARILRGKLADRDTAIIDYRYTTGSGKSAHTHRQTVVVFTDGAKGLPEFQLSPEGLLHGLAEVFGAQDIDFEQNEEFSKRYLLKGPDEAAIRRAFTIDALAWFAAAPGWRVQTRGGRLLAFRGDKLVDPAEVPAFAAETLRIVGLFRT